MNLVIIDYDSGNLHSAAKAFERANADAGTGHTISVSASPRDVRRADRIVLPGVGAFGDCFSGLTAISGMREALEEAVVEKGRPFLGICVGMQLLAERGLEHGTQQGLGWIRGEVRPIKPKDPQLKIPHMGWNTLEGPQTSPSGGLAQIHPLLEGIPLGPAGLHAYFVHSYHFVPKEAGTVAATTDYGGSVTAMVARGNIAGTQFHPEKSQRLGLRLIANFLNWTP